MSNMERKFAVKILIVASVVFGGAIAIMAVAGSPVMGTVSIVGATTLGLLWVLTALFGKPSSTDERSS
ncbi:hypothetical protein [Microlunatus sp. GCM10028923]|uniref:hypothetical protein n=1 Tax=Microlunatus sp. GCM10028923 TaxID=3273400 RepID=UPI003618A1C7